MAAHNPYAPSAASLRLDPAARPNASAAGSVWREGNVLVMEPDAKLPPRCVKCNESCELPKKPRTVYWHHWTIYLLLLFNIIIYAIVAMIARRKASVAPGMCQRHGKRRRTVILIAWIGVIGSLAVMVASVDQKGPLLFLVGLLVLLASMFFGVISSRIVWAKHIDKDYVRLKGCEPEFLATLPKFPH